MKWKKAYEAGAIILADRYTTSNMVHQAVKLTDREERESFLDWLWDFEFNKLGLPVPDKVVFLDMDPEVADQLIAARAAAQAQERDIHERDKEYLHRCHAAYEELAKKYGVALLKTTDGTSSCMSTLISYLSVELAPRITRHGVFVEVYGEGVLIMGESGMGKSETALELIKRGHRLVADDAVEIRKVSHKTLVGSAPENIRHFIELRGVGVVNARRLFGIGSVKVSEKINMVIQLEPWNAEKNYERLGLDNETIDILGIDIPICVVPVTPGRNISIIIEAAAMNNRQKKMGYNAAKQLLHNLGMTDDIKVEENELEIWHNF